MKDFLNSAEAGEFLGVNPWTLNKWRKQGFGPQYERVHAKCILYPLAELEAFKKRYRKWKHRKVRPRAVISNPPA